MLTLRCNPDGNMTWPAYAECEGWLHKLSRMEPIPTHDLWLKVHSRAETLCQPHLGATVTVPPPVPAFKARRIKTTAIMADEDVTRAIEAMQLERKEAIDSLENTREANERAVSDHAHESVADRPSLDFIKVTT